MSETPRQLRTQCCVVGGGPAGLMLALLLARAGVDVMVLEKHGDFLRDFRGDTIHPSTLEVIHELGLLDDFLRRPHQEVGELRVYVGDRQVTTADFRHLPTRCRFLALMPQWDFLDFLVEHARRYETFRLRMQAQVTGLLREDGEVRGVRAETPDGPIEVRADLTIGADGRSSSVRAAANLPVRDRGAPIDVLWMRISRADTDPDLPFGRFDRGRILVLIYRGTYWQCGFVIPKGGRAVLEARGIEDLRRQIAEAVPFLAERVDELRSWDDVKLLTVKVDRLTQWYRPGLLCIGDAAHAMSPVGGVGINLAIQDAVATANLLAEPLRTGALTVAHLARVQRRREFPTRVTQRAQLFVQEHVLRASLESGTARGPSRLVDALERWPVLRRLPAFAVGMGVRPEHVRI